MVDVGELMRTADGIDKLRDAVARACGWECRVAVQSGNVYWRHRDGGRRLSRYPPICFWRMADMWKVWRDALPRGKGQVWCYEDGIDYHAIWRGSDGYESRIEAPTFAAALIQTLIAVGVVRLDD